MKLYGNFKHLFIFLIFLIFLNISYANEDIYSSQYFNINKTTNNVSYTKNDEINKIKIKSLLNILDKILIQENKNKLLKYIEYEKDLENLIQNIIIENELITPNKYKAKVKINIDKKELIQLLRNNKINYTDIRSQPFLVISVLNDKFDSYGLTLKNIFYDFDNVNLQKYDDNLINIIFPYLDVNDRYILPYFKINDKNISAFKNIAKKYNTNNLFIIDIKQISLKQYDISIYIFNNDDVVNISNFSIDEFSKIHNEFFFKISEWWKNDNIIENNLLNKIKCTINSKNFSDLIFIKNKISNLSQFKSINLVSILYNKNIEEIQYYGDYDIFLKSLYYSKINLINDNGCFISSLE